MTTWPDHELLSMGRDPRPDNWLTRLFYRVVEFLGGR